MMSKILIYFIKPLVVISYGSTIGFSHASPLNNPKQETFGRSKAALTFKFTVRFSAESKMQFVSQQEVML